MANPTSQQSKKCLNPILLSKDREILQFLWRHRIATFDAIKAKFFSQVSNQQAYYILRRLRRGQYVRVEKLNGTKNTVWVLDRRGFLYLSDNGQLPDLKTRGFRPQSKYHDLLAAAALTGDWMVKMPSGVSIVTEQEMLALHLSCLPREIRKEREHQPDGLWIFQSGKDCSAIALEIESSAKTNERYEQICSFYVSQVFFDHVVWIVTNKTLAERILETSQRHGMPRMGLHLFILQQNFEKLGWDSQFENKSLGDVSLANFLSSKAGVRIKTSNHPRITGASPSNPPVVLQPHRSPFLNFRVSLENLSILRSNRPASAS
jgi:hypothetical protein